MKKYFTLFALALSVIMLTASCDNDLTKSEKLAGEWTGYFGSYYDYEYIGRDGRTYVERFESDYVDMQFVPDYDFATHGYGTEVDWYRTGPYTKQYFRFEWSIHDGIIDLFYPHDRDMSVRISNYSISYDYFTGRIGKTDFRLRKIVDYYDWRGYRDDWGYIYNPGWGYGYYNARSMKSDSTDIAPSAPADMSSGRIIKRGNIFAEEQ